MPAKAVTKAELQAFAKELFEQIGPPPDNFEQIVEEAIVRFKKKQKEEG